jgi:hypothetical protein
MVFVLSAAADDQTIEVALKNFKFKVDEGHASLFGLNEDEGKLFFYTNGKAEAAVKLPADGEYEITIKASGDPALNERAKFKLYLDGELVGKETELKADEAKEYSFKVNAKAGERKVAIEFTNDAYKENEYDRNLYVHAVTVKKK